MFVVLQTIVFALCMSIRIQQFLVLCWLVHVLHPPQKSERQIFCSGLKGIKEHGMEGALNNTISTKCNRNLLLISSTVTVMKVIETGWRTDKYNGNLVSDTFLFKWCSLNGRDCTFIYMNVFVSHQQFKIKRNEPVCKLVALYIICISLLVLQIKSLRDITSFKQVQFVNDF